LGGRPGAPGGQATAEAALKSPEESDIAQRAAGAAMQTDGMQRRIVLLDRQKPTVSR